MLAGVERVCHPRAPLIPGLRRCPDFSLFTCVEWLSGGAGFHLAAPSH
jgi:hypothetical protein